MWMSVPTFETIRLDVADYIATLTLSRPDQLNAFNREMMAEMIAAFDYTDTSDDVRVVVVTGEGRAFCAGADLAAAGGDTFNAGARGRDSMQAGRDGGGRVSMRIFDSLKPVIGAINGHAVGVGITMTLPMDIRFIDESAKVGFVFARRGITPEACSSWFLPRIVGISQASEWCMTGRVFSGKEAADAGLGKHCEQGTALDRAMELAREIAVHAAPVSASVSRQLLWQGLTFDHPMESHRADSRAIHALGSQADAKEGVTSFLEKRDPEWSLKVSEDLPEIFPFVSQRFFS